MTHNVRRFTACAWLYLKVSADNEIHRVRALGMLHLIIMALAEYIHLLAYQPISPTNYSNNGSASRVARQSWR